jgi:phosphohistidine swiveling domain-containing protein
VLRERLGSHYTFTYGLFRYYYLAMAEHLVKQGLIDTSVDVFYLPVETVHHLLLGGDSNINLRAEIIRHKAAMEMFKEVSLPNVIYGEEEPPVVDESSERLYGLATSLGHYTGPARVVHGLTDYNKVREGDVLIIPYSDVGWTPLFAHVKAVVAESGGLLSHSSIIAREYGIPAVVSVNGAMKLIDDTLITVDGHKGEVVIHPLI